MAPSPFSWLAPLSILAAASLLAAPLPASAGCVAPEPELIWSYPADGAVEVPTDAVLWLLGSTGPTRVLLDGAPVAANQAGPRTNLGWAHDPGGLAPNTDYALSVFLPSDSGTDDEVEITFRTGAGPYAAAASVAITGASATPEWEHFDATCQAIIAVQDCYDTGQDTHVIIEVEGVAELYLLTATSPGGTGTPVTVAWPSACGSPSLYTYGYEELCYRVHAVDAAGALAASEELCVRGDELPRPGDEPQREEEPPEGGSRSPFGCATTPAGLGSLPILALAATALRRRRSAA